MARYRKVDSRIWNDEKFRSLSDDGQLVFLFLLTHPHQTALGAMRATVSGLAEEKGWLNESLPESLRGRFEKAFTEALSRGMVRYDAKASCVWLPNFLKYNRPESPNVVRAWGSAADLIPECRLKSECIQAAKAFLKGFKEAFRKAFTEVFGEALPKDYALSGSGAGAGTGTGSGSLPSADCVRTDPNTGGLRDDTPLDPDRDPQNQDGWLACRASYPPHIHPEADWLIAERDACMRVEEGEAPWSELKAGCERLYAQQEAKGNLGTQFVPSPKGMFTRREKRWREPYPLPATKAEQRLTGNVAAAAEAKRRLFGGGT
jgi:hypothetical protein